MLKKVTLEYDDEIRTIKGDEAQKWSDHNKTLAILAQSHRMNPFDIDPVRWKVKKFVDFDGLDKAVRKYFEENLHAGLPQRVSSIEKSLDEWKIRVFLETSMSIYPDKKFDKGLKRLGKKYHADDVYIYPGHYGK